MAKRAIMVWVLGFILIGFTVYQLRLLSRLEFKTTGKKLPIEEGKHDDER
jgi:hypothetical protein